MNNFLCQLILYYWHCNLTPFILQETYDKKRYELQTFTVDINCLYLNKSTKTVRSLGLPLSSTQELYHPDNIRLISVLLIPD